MGGRAVTKKMDYRWHLRTLMAERDMFQTSDIGPLLAERGISLSGEQCFGLSLGRRSGCRWTSSLRYATSSTAACKT